jgi:hypothetical protein
MCGNQSLALGGKAIWYQCLSGGFYNLYDRSWAPQCSPIYIVAMGSSAPASVSTGTSDLVYATTAVSQKTDGEVIPTTGTVVGHISDGQVQNSVTAPTMSMAHVSQMTDGQVIASPVSTLVLQQNSDEQIDSCHCSTIRLCCYREIKWPARGTSSYFYSSR